MMSVIEVEFELMSVDTMLDMDIEGDIGIIKFDISSGDVQKPYTGNYEVIPKIVDQVLETKNLSMTEDVTVKEIPTHKVSNEFGTTIIIGGVL